MKFGRNVLHALTDESVFSKTSYFQDGGHDVKSRIKGNDMPSVQKLPLENNSREYFKKIL